MNILCFSLILIDPLTVLLVILAAALVSHFPSNTSALALLLATTSRRSAATSQQQQQQRMKVMWSFSGEIAPHVFLTVSFSWSYFVFYSAVSTFGIKKKSFDHCVIVSGPLSTTPTKNLAKRGAGCWLQYKGIQLPNAIKLYLCRFRCGSIK